MNYFLKSIRDITNVLMLGEMDMRHAKAGHGNIIRATRVNIDDTLSLNSSMTLGHV